MVYLFYNCGSVKLDKIVLNVLIMVYNEGFDVYYMLDIMDNKLSINKLKFKKGIGGLYYYLYNWICLYIKNEKLGVVLF